jgi:hypothetical protein
MKLRQAKKILKIFYNRRGKPYWNRTRLHTVLNAINRVGSQILEAIIADSWYNPQTSIPLGHYCYTIIGHSPGKIKVKICPFWRKMNKGAYCTYMRTYANWGDTSNLIWDQCKECGINRGEDE